MSPNRKGESIMSPSRVHSSVRSIRGPSGRPLALAVALALAATPLWAQDAAPDTSADKNADKKAKTLESVVVTGSHIRRVDVETASPVITIDRQRIEDTGKATIGDLLQDMFIDDLKYLRDPVYAYGSWIGAGEVAGGGKYVDNPGSPEHWSSSYAQYLTAAAWPPVSLNFRRKRPLPRRAGLRPYPCRRCA